jgi:hypothetical protein
MEKEYGKSTRYTTNNEKATKSFGGLDPTKALAATW